MNPTLRIVATRSRDFDPAFLAFHRIHRHCSEHSLDIVVDLPGWSGGQASVGLWRPGEAEEILALVALPAGGENGDALQLEASLAFSTFFLQWVESSSIGFVHAFSWNLWHLVNQLAVIRGLPGLISLRGLDVMRGAAFGQVMYANTQAPNVVVHCPSLELKRKLELLEIARRIHFVPNGVTLEDVPADAHQDPVFKSELSAYGSVILIPGNVGEERGLTFCLRNIAQGVRRRTIVVLAGSRGFLLSDQEVVSWCKNEGFAFELRVVGPISHSEIQKWYRLATLAIFPGGREGGQTSILECIAADVPVLVESNETNRTLFGESAPYVYSPNSMDLPRLIERLQTDEEFERNIQSLQRAVIEKTLTVESEFRSFEAYYLTQREQQKEAGS